jgi:hypothetical protein
MTPSIGDTYGAPLTMVELRRSVAAWPITVTATARGRSHRRSFHLRTWTESTGPLLRPVLRATPGTVPGTVDLDASSTWSAHGPPTFHWDADGDGRSDHAGGASPTWTTPVLRPGWNLLTVLVRDGAALMQEHVSVWIDVPLNQGPVITVPASGPDGLVLP